MPNEESILNLNRRKFLTAAAIAGAAGSVDTAKAATPNSSGRSHNCRRRYRRTREWWPPKPRSLMFLPTPGRADRAPISWSM